MKKQKVLTMFTVLAVNAQYYVGSSTSNENDIFGNTITMHQSIDTSTPIWCGSTI